MESLANNTENLKKINIIASHPFLPEIAQYWVITGANWEKAYKGGRGITPDDSEIVSFIKLIADLNQQLMTDLLRSNKLQITDQDIQSAVFVHLKNQRNKQRLGRKT